MNKLKNLTKGLPTGIPGLGQIDDCMDTFKLMPENIMNFLGSFKEKSKLKGGEAVNILKFIGTVLLFICVFPALPFLFIMAIMISTIKYLMLKLGNI